MSGYILGNRILSYCKNNPKNCPYTFETPINSLQNQVNTINKEISTINKEISGLESINIVGSYNISPYDNTQYGNTKIRIGWYDGGFYDSGKANVCIGSLANGGFYNTSSGNYNVSLGNITLTQNVSGIYNTAIGHNSQYSCSTGGANTSIGYGALYDNVDGSFNVAVGSAAGNNNTGSNNTFIGRRAGRNSSSVNYNYTTCLGSGSLATGSNQIILGTSSQSVYGGTYNTISDARDKIEIRDTILGLKFIEKLRPVDYKYNFRTVTNGDEVEDNENNIINKKGNRYHHGLIAQEVKLTMDDMGIDFAGYQDHKINGGIDQLTIGYSELIGPMIKSIQELNNKIKILEDKLSKQ